MKNYIMAIAMLLAFACNNTITPSATPYRNNELVNEKGATILIGHNAPFMIKQGANKEWFDKNYQYTVDSAVIEKIKPLLAKKTIEIFLGSWCGDSKREVPRMMKILDHAGFDTADLRLVFVDYTVKAYKQSPQHEEKGKNIHRVPTFIIYDGRKELGRIIETPVVSLEKDLLAIVGGERYIPKYRAVLQWRKDTRRPAAIRSEDDLRSIAATLQPLCSSYSEFNAYGYMLFAAGNKREALNIFRLNSFLFPDKPGPFSALGEYYFLTGNKAAARKCYEKVLQLKPDDGNARKMLEQL